VTVRRSKRLKARLHTRYPLSSLVLYNGSTGLHFALGGIGLMLGYGFSWAAYLAGGLYLAFALGEMYVLMPLKVCPNCIYYRIKDSRCISGLNVVSRKIARQGDVGHFARRAQGPLCSNNLYLAALLAPILALIPALILSFSFLLLGIWLALVGLLLFRFMVLFTQVACVHCRARYRCPQAKQMNLQGT
jgi:hypothetical protein